ncbi:MAG TPA: hypothetical protein EYQ67_07105 [Dehalococcoidia bacterium]|nr:hypothetical protein [Dehalococcoidia bacterium]
MQKLLNFLSGMFSGSNDAKGPPKQSILNKPDDDVIPPESNLATTPEKSTDVVELEVQFPEYLGLSSEYKNLILERILKTGHNPLTRGYPRDTSNDETDFVARNLLARDMLWTSRRDDNEAIRNNIEDEAAKLLELNLRLADLAHSHFPSEHLRILYSKRKDWQNAARVMDVEFQLGSSDQMWVEERQPDWEKKRARVSKNGY